MYGVPFWPFGSALALNGSEDLDAFALEGAKSGLGGGKGSGLACADDCMATENTGKGRGPVAPGVGDGAGPALGLAAGARGSFAARLCAGDAGALFSGEIRPGTQGNLL